MPMISDGTEAPRVQVRASAPLELMWLVHDCEASHTLEGPLATLEEVRRRFGERFKAFWADGVRGFVETVVLAERGGTLYDVDLDRFFDTLDEAVKLDGRPTLLSEPLADRRLLHARLERLREDAELRAAYKALLVEAWGAVREDWETAGRPAVLRAAEEWQRRIDAGANFRELLERPRIWPNRPELEELADQSAIDGRLVFSPGWYFGVVHVVEIDGLVLVGRRIRTSDPAIAQRKIASAVSAKMKALADPTRLAILMWLAGHPTSVTQVAKHFDLSQPTVSAHIQLLREAGLIEEKATGRSSTLTVTERRLRELLSDVEEALLRQFPPD
jgi:DNA-binding transcriptional ArsR family regulator